MRFEFNNWMTKKNSFNTKANKGIPVPMRIMSGVILKETENSYYVKVQGKPEPTVTCLHCNRKLTNKVSQMYGLGPVCGGHFYITNITESNIEEKMDEIRQKMEAITWEGVVPKTAVKVKPEDMHSMVFFYNGQEYKVKTKDKTKVKEIYEKANVVLVDKVYPV